MSSISQLFARRVFLRSIALLSTVSYAASLFSAEPELITARNNFDDDPGWEGVRNRIVCADCPAIEQDFGWSPTNHVGAGAGEIGGIVWQSRTPAWYALPLDPALSYDDPFSFACSIAFMPVEEQLSPKASNNAGNAYIGFFNHERQGYRPWSSAAIRLNGSGGDGPESKIGMWLAYMSADWGAAGFDLNLKGRTWRSDGETHTLSMRYDPDDILQQNWADAELKQYITEAGSPGPERVSTSQVFERARQSEPEITESQLQERLIAVAAEGLVMFARVGHEGRDQDTWDIISGPLRGSFTMEFDGVKAKTFVSAEHRAQDMRLDRFGLFNHQVYHQFLKFYVSDLTVNGNKINLSQDPRWEAVGNHVQYVEEDFQRQDFGYSAASSYSGGNPGEIGGLFSRTDYRDPNHGYYADEVGTLTLDDPVSFSGKMGFPGGNTDSGMFIGYFNAAEQMKELPDADRGRSVHGALGIFIEATSSRGYDFSALVGPLAAPHSLKYGTNFVPRPEPYTFTFEYDPVSGDGFGQMRFSLNHGEIYIQNLTREQRASPTTFDRFGLLSRRVGGTNVEIYFDDLAYTARRPEGSAPVRHIQQQTVVPYPRGGREL